MLFDYEKTGSADGVCISGNMGQGYLKHPEIVTHLDECANYYRENQLASTGPVGVFDVMDKANNSQRGNTVLTRTLRFLPRRARRPRRNH